MTGSLASRLADRIETAGPMAVSEYLAAALYDPAEGFFMTSGRAGRSGDFLTAPEIGPLFGAVLAGALDRWWDELDRPEPFTVIDWGAGPGTLTRSVLAARPRCLQAEALRWIAVEVSAAQRANHPLHGAVVSVADVSQAVTAPIVGVVLANELLDNLPFDIVERNPTGWRELRVVYTPGDPATSFALQPVAGMPPGLEALAALDKAGPAVEAESAGVAGPAGVAGSPAGVAGPLDVTGSPAGVAGPAGRLYVAGSPAGMAGSASAAGSCLPILPVGVRVPLQRTARNWVAAAHKLLQAGRVVVFDYGADTATLARRETLRLEARTAGEHGPGCPDPTSQPPAWLRVHSGHERFGSWLHQPGSRDITVDVAFDQIQLDHQARVCSQAEFLSRHGIEDLVAAGRREWAERAAIADLQALAARSRSSESQALLDPAGMGSFTVLEWSISCL